MLHSKHQVIEFPTYRELNSGSDLLRFLGDILDEDRVTSKSSLP